jgi:hypothetical protein
MMIGTRVAYSRYGPKSQNARQTRDRAMPARTQPIPEVVNRYHLSRRSGPSSHRRQWFCSTAGTALGLVAGSCFPLPAAQAAQWVDALGKKGDIHDEEYRATETKVRKATTLPIHTATSAHYRAIGDASESFMKLILNDCELIALDYLDYFRARGFDVALPSHLMTVVVFVDERPFRRYGPEMPPQVTGLYRRSENSLVLFDFRNVPMRQRRAGSSNLHTLAHESTHLLEFNTGLLNRKGDAARSVVEGLAIFSEVRRSTDRSQPGQINQMRLDDLAHIQRRRDWIPTSTLLTDDRTAFGNTVDHVLLAYAQSWFLVYHLMTTPDRLSQFRAYLKAIYSRVDDTHRLEDAQSHFGDLAKLDKELRVAAAQLQQTR